MMSSKERLRYNNNLSLPSSLFLLLSFAYYNKIIFKLSDGSHLKQKQSLCELTKLLHMIYVLDTQHTQVWNNFSSRKMMTSIRNACIYINKAALNTCLCKRQEKFILNYPVIDANMGVPIKACCFSLNLNKSCI